MSWLCLVLGHREVLVDLKEDNSWRSWWTMRENSVVLKETYLCTRCKERREVRALGQM